METAIYMRNVSELTKLRENAVFLLQFFNLSIFQPHVFHMTEQYLCNCKKKKKKTQTIIFAINSQNVN